ncbi:MAG: (Fe-S)-binding protein, partial [Pseudomonadota bacterium]
PPLTTSAILERIDRQNRVEEILKLLPRKECSVCGCPDCRTFAEDVAGGKAKLQGCFLWEKQKETLGIHLPP